MLLLLLAEQRVSLPEQFFKEGFKVHSALNKLVDTQKNRVRFSSYTVLVVCYEQGYVLALLRAANPAFHLFRPHRYGLPMRLGPVTFTRKGLRAQAES